MAEEPRAKNALSVPDPEPLARKAPHRRTGATCRWAWMTT